MNRYAAVKQMADMNNFEIAEAVNEDVVSLYLFERGLAPIHIDTAYAICDLLEVEMKELFPNLTAIFDASDEIVDREELSEFLLEPENRMALLSSGLDPDVRDWIMIVDLFGGVERRYRMSSPEKERLEVELSGMADLKGFLTFYADCQHILLKKESIFEISFVVAASYAPFSSRERAHAITAAYTGTGKIETLMVLPDDGDRSPFLSLVQAGAVGKDLPPFLSVTTGSDEETRFVSLLALDLLEIPVGVVFSDVYNEDTEKSYPLQPTELEDMVTAGRA